MLAGLFLLAVSLSVHAVETAKKPALKTSDLYQATNVWTVHFTFTSEDRGMAPSDAQ